MDIEILISESSMTYMAMTGIIWIVLPIAACIFAGIRWKTGPVPILLGALTFFTAQMLLRVPLLGAVYSIPAVNSWAQANPSLSNLFMALSTALFMEGSRFIVFAALMRNQRGWADGVTFGLGYGGFEALLIVGLDHINDLITAAAFTSGALNTLTPEDAAQVTEAAAVLAQSTTYGFIAANLQSVFTVCLHIGLTLLIVHAVRVKKWSWLGYAIALHTFSSFATATLASLPWGLLWSTLFLGAIAALCVLYTVRVRRQMAK